MSGPACIRDWRSEPVSVNVNAFGTEKVALERSKRQRGKFSTCVRQASSSRSTCCVQFIPKPLPMDTWPQ